MTAATDVDHVLIEHLDFEPPCEVTYDGGKVECELPAAWRVVSHGHCVQENIYDQFFCVDHYEYLMSGGHWSCEGCGSSHDGRGNIIRTERLRP